MIMNEYRIDRYGRRWCIRDQNDGIHSKHGSVRDAEDALRRLQEREEEKAA